MFHRFRRNGDSRGGTEARRRRRSAARARWPWSVRAAGGTRGAPGSGTARRTRPACGTRSAGIGTTPRAADRSAATCAAASCRAARGSATRCAAAVCPSVRRPRSFGYGAARAAAAADDRTGRPRWSEGCATDPARKRDAARRAGRCFWRGNVGARRPQRRSTTKRGSATRRDSAESTTRHDFSRIGRAAQLRRLHKTLLRNKAGLSRINKARVSRIGRAAQLRRLHKTSLRNKVSGISKM